MAHVLHPAGASGPIRQLPSCSFQTGFSIDHLDYNDLYEPGVAVPEGVYNGTAQIDTGYAGNGTGVAFIAGGVQQQYQTTRNFYTEQATYITGNHQIRAGFQFSNGRNDYGYIANGDAYEYFIVGVPQSVPGLQHAD